MRHIAVWSDTPITVPLHFPDRYAAAVVVASEALPGYQGTASATGGTGWYVDPHDLAAEKGSVLFFSLRRGSLLELQ